jgi:phage-related protein
VAKSPEAVHVLNAFATTSQKTLKSELDLAQRRCAQMTAIRRPIAE